MGRNKQNSQKQFKKLQQLQSQLEKKMLNLSIEKVGVGRREAELKCRENEFDKRQQKSKIHRRVRIAAEASKRRYKTKQTKKLQQLQTQLDKKQQDISRKEREVAERAAAVGEREMIALPEEVIEEYAGNAGLLDTDEKRGKFRNAMENWFGNIDVKVSELDNISFALDERQARLERDKLDFFARKKAEEEYERELLLRNVVVTEREDEVEYREERVGKVDKVLANIGRKLL